MANRFDTSVTRSYYLVRTLEDLVELDLVGVGWSDFDFTAYDDVEKLISAIEAHYSIGRRANQIRRFFRIAQGDVIIVPLPYCIGIGMAQGGVLHDKNYYNRDRANQRRVRFLRDSKGKLITVLREELTEAFQRRINVRGMTVNDLPEFGPEIETLLKSHQEGTPFSSSSAFEILKQERQSKFKRDLLSSIQSGNTYLRTKGIGLEHLVKELLECEGYQKVQVLSKRAFGSFADADVQGIKSDIFTSRTLLIQVKHHQGTSGEWGIDQLEELKRLAKPEDPDFNLAFVTSAAVSESLVERANDSDIKVVDGECLVDWIYDNLAKLSLETKAKLGICEIPSLPLVKNQT